jgi:hypothetical protein
VYAVNSMLLSDYLSSFLWKFNNSHESKTFLQDSGIMPTVPSVSDE